MISPLQGLLDEYSLKAMVETSQANSMSRFISIYLLDMCQGLDTFLLRMIFPTSTLIKPGRVNKN